MVVYGVHPIAELLGRAAAGRGEWPRAAELLVARDNAAVRRLGRQAEVLGIPVRQVSAAELARRCGSDAHRGVALVGAPGSGRTPANSVRRAPPGAGRAAAPVSLRAALAGLSQRPAALVAVADGITDPANLGSITRSAEQFGTDLLVVPRRRSARFDDTVMRVSAGAAAHVAAVPVSNVAAALEQFKRAGFWIYGADLAGEPLDEVRFPARVALVLGSEGGGLHELVRRRCDHLVRIPTRGRLDSLNVAVAAAILLYEVVRQRRSRT
ncbi:MAG: 23S rRNA (guanosine(2251)-2'-O)-methyltransferase RlmB [Spirochaetaceae bacterium]|nr:23S rRNA (guanosine(2251)-2'-O)-methyltransferase RlmB [Spirochaetaceae bacterium]